MLTLLLGVNPATGNEQQPLLSVVVMDPLAAPLSCPCVEGYAQRKYEVLAEHLESFLGCEVELTYGESLAASLKTSGGKADLVIGKQSVVRADAATANINLTAISRLTDRQGSTEQFGLIVVGRDDPAKSIDDLVGYTVILGPAEAEEKHSAAIQLLREAGIAIPETRRQLSTACSDGACKVLDLGPESKTAAVISSYAQPLLEGCGTINKGDLRVVGKTAAVPFVTVFASSTLAEDELAKIEAALADVALQPDVLRAMESLVGFLPIEQSMPFAKKKG